MESLIQRFASLKIAVGLLALIVAAMAAGTIVESASGTDQAARLVYYSTWFRGLLALLALNIACSLWVQWPWGWRRAGFALTHGSMLVILAGAFVTDRLKVEGRMALWEGEESIVFGRLGADGEPTHMSLPFSVKLESFEIDYYPGSMSPAMFRSRVIVNDRAAKRSFPAVIEMNRELSYAGYSLYQSSYEQTPERDRTILSVSKDPGQGIVFAGYAFLMIGMLTVLATRMVEAGAAQAVKRSHSSVKTARRVAALGLALALGWPGAGMNAAEAATVPDSQTVEALRRLPVQHDGRVMPLDTLAREASRQVLGRYEWNGLDSVSLVLGWAFDPQGWAAEPIIEIGSPDLLTAIGMLPAVRLFSFHELAGNPKLLDLMQRARLEAQQGRRPEGLLEEAREIEERLIRMQGFLQGTAFRVIPPAGNPQERWLTPEHVHSAADLVALAATKPAGPHASAALIDAEITYNRVRPSRLSWWILLPATAVSLLAWNLRKRWLDIPAVSGLLAGLGVMTWGILARWEIAGRIPASNMYESMLFLGWGVALFAIIALVFLRNRLVVLNATAMSALTMILTDCLPIDPFIHPMPPVLSGTPWLAIHVPIIMVSYSVLALGVLIAHLRVGFEIFAPGKKDLAGKMSDLLYWYMHIGSILLIAGILTGSIWAASSWGRYWGWDPKEVWSLIAFLVYLGILHGRLEKILGTFGVATLSIAAFWAIVMTYVGVNYVLTTGLHSYGFGGASVVRWLLAVAALEGLFLTAGVIFHRANARRPKESRATA